MYNAIRPVAVNHSPLGQLLRKPAGLLAGLILVRTSYYMVEKTFLELKSTYGVKTPRDLTDNSAL